MNVGIIGASGYSGEELVRLLVRHPRARLVSVTSRTLAGQPLGQALPRLRGVVPPSLVFAPSEPAALAADSKVDLYFLALPHGVAAEYARPLIAAGKRVIDLSADFRLASPEIYREFYGYSYSVSELLKEVVYVLPEIMRDGWQQKKLLACPGCYPTSVLVPLVPLLRAGLVSAENIVVNSFSGVSGAGKKVDEEYLFCERAESAKAYGFPKHRHLSEIEEQLSAAAGAKVIIQFTPHLAPMRRGIATTIVARAKVANADAVLAAWQDAYANRPFVQILPRGQNPDTALVTGTNRIDLAAAHDPRTGNVVLVSAEDNLLKGASGQAVQIMNLVAGWPESEGLL
jgi:N-acetyl-gamma-glutamyl-phosphate reductase